LKKFDLVTFTLMVTMLVSCAATSTSVKHMGSAYPAREKNCEVEFFKDEEPMRTFEVLAEIESHIKRNFFLGGTVQLESEAYEELRRKACSLGGDAVVIDDYMETAASEMTHVHVWATVVRFK